jgi:hypothetical protein
VTKQHAAASRKPILFCQRVNSPHRFCKPTGFDKRRSGSALISSTFGCDHPPPGEYTKDGSCSPRTSVKIQMPWSIGPASRRAGHNVAVIYGLLESG